LKRHVDHDCFRGVFSDGRNEGLPAESAQRHQPARDAALLRQGRQHTERVGEYGKRLGPTRIGKLNQQGVHEDLPTRTFYHHGLLTPTGIDCSVRVLRRSRADGRIREMP
jgi:hypothetical protein